MQQRMHNKKRKQGDWWVAGTIEMRKRIVKKCRQQLEVDAKDKWAVDVLSRVEGCATFWKQRVCFKLFALIQPK